MDSLFLTVVVKQADECLGDWILPKVVRWVDPIEKLVGAGVFTESALVLKRQSEPVLA